MPKAHKYPIGSKRAVMAGIDLFYPKASPTEKRKKVQKFLRRIKITSDKKLQRKAASSLRPGIESSAVVYEGYRGKRIFTTKQQLKIKGMPLHELAHFFELGKNDLVTANALTGYLRHVKGTFEPRALDYASHIKSIEGIIKQGRKLRGYGLEYRGNEPIDVPAKNFGAFAADKEREWKKPAAGLFLIRETCNGLPVDDAIKKIESGVFDKEINAFAEKHLANLLRNPP